MPSSEVCPACERARGLAYFATPYGEEDHEHICPWCIADGTAHAKLDVEFVDGWHLEAENVPASVLAEVTQRTPAYLCWQSEQWLVCCGDACEFHGDASAAELRALDDVAIRELASMAGFDEDAVPEIIEAYEPCGSPAFYKFICRHCGKPQYGGDCD